jgi:hypothetical protein
MMSFLVFPQFAGGVEGLAAFAAFILVAGLFGHEFLLLAIQVSPKATV